jgi:hypothetical protein
LGGTFFHLSPAEAVLSDSNLELTHSCQVVKDHPEDLIESVATLTGAVAAGLPRHFAFVAAVFGHCVAS